MSSLRLSTSKRCGECFIRLARSRRVRRRPGQACGRRNFQPYRQADQALFEIEAAAELLGERTHQAQTLPGRDRRIEAFGQSYPVVRNFDGQAAVRTFA